MKTQLSSFQMLLEAGSPVSIRQGRSTGIRVLDGLVWITEEGSLDDVFVSAGASFELRGRGQAVLMSDRQSRVELYAPTPLLICSDGFWAGVFSRFQALGRSQPGARVRWLTV